MADEQFPEERPDPFAGLPIFGDLSRALAGQGPINWEAARQFAQGVVDRAGDNGLLPLLERADAVPTPAEVDAPGLWLERLATGES